MFNIFLFQMNFEIYKFNQKYADNIDLIEFSGWNAEFKKQQLPENN